MKKRIIAGLAALSLLMTAGGAVFAAKGANDVNVAVGKTVYSRYYDSDTETWAGTGWTATKTVDGDRGTYFVPFPPSGDPEYITIDLGREYPITQVSMYKLSGKTGTYGSGDSTFNIYVSKSWSGRSDNFKEQTGAVQLTADADFTQVSGDNYLMNYYPDGSNGWYRYVQLQYDKVNQLADQRIAEIEVYSPDIDGCTNRAQGKTAIVINNDGNVVTSDYYGMYGTGFVDGTTGTHGGLANGAVVIDLEYAQKIEYVEAVTRYYNGNQRGFNVYLSNAGTWHLPQGGDWIQIGEAASEKIYEAGKPLYYLSNTDRKYRYVLISGYNHGECISAEVRVYGKDSPVILSDTDNDAPASQTSVSDNGDGTYDASFEISSVTADDFNSLKIYFTRYGSDNTPVERERYKYPISNLGITGSGTVTLDIDVTNIPEQFTQTQMWISADN